MKQCYSNIVPLLLALFCTLFSVQTCAAIIDHGSYISDSHTGLDWLKLTETYSTSYNQVTSHMNEGEAFFGWRYASAEELFDLFSSDGVDCNCYFGTSFLPNEVIDSKLHYYTFLISLLGDPLPFDKGFSKVEGIFTYKREFIERSQSHDPEIIITARQKARLSNHPNDSTIWWSHQVDSESSSDVGSFLVRSSHTISEPSSIYLLALYLIGTTTWWSTIRKSKLVARG